MGVMRRRGNGYRAPSRRDRRGRHFPRRAGTERKDPLLPARDSGSVSRLAPLLPQNVVNERDASSAVSKASKWSFSAWETTQLAVYRDCMTAHDQVE
jgi:hypothetical protein